MLRRFSLGLPLLFVTGWLAAQPVTGNPTFTPLPVEEALRVRSFPDDAPVTLSPDGEWVAYTLRDETQRRPRSEGRYQWFGPTGVSTFAANGCDVWITNTRTGAARNLTNGRGTSWSPTWSPQGDRLAFYSDRSGQAGLWLWERKTGKLRQLSREIVRPLFNSEAIRWTPNGKYVLCKLLPAGMTLADAARKLTVEALREAPETTLSTSRTVLVERSHLSAEEREQATAHKSRQDSFELTNRSRGDLALIDVQRGQVRRIGTGIYPYTWWVSPTGEYLAYTSNPDVQLNPANDLHRLVIFSIRENRGYTAATLPRTWWGRPLAWSPDGKQFCAVSFHAQKTTLTFFQPFRKEATRTLEIPVAAGDVFQKPVWDSASRTVYLIVANALWRVSLASGAATQVAQMPGYRLESIVCGAGTRRTESPDASRFLYLHVRHPESGREGFHRVDLQSGRSEPLREALESYSGAVELSRDSRRITYLAESAQHPSEVWSLDVHSAQPRRITRANPALDRYALGAARLVEWQGAAGQSLRGALLLPPGYQPGTRCPLVVRVYGGSRLSNQVNRYGFWGTGVDDAQLLATRGYAVFMPDAPLRNGKQAEDLAGTVLPGIDRVVELGFADPERIGVIGHSFGGYSTLVLLTRDRRFRAAVVTGGMSNLFNAHLSMRAGGESMTEFWEGKLGGTPWQIPQTYLENSPLFFLDRIRTPLLMVHGTNDVSIPVQQAEAVFVGLRRLGQEVELARYLGEEHVPARWNAAHQRDYCQRMLAWFARHLGSP